MTLDEMCWLVAVYGDEDIPLYKRERLFQHSSMPAIAGVIQDGRDFVGNLNDRRLLHRKREPHPVLRIV